MWSRFRIYWRRIQSLGIERQSRILVRKHGNDLENNANRRRQLEQREVHRSLAGCSRPVGADPRTVHPDAQRPSRDEEEVGRGPLRDLPARELRAPKCDPGRHQWRTQVKSGQDILSKVWRCVHPQNPVQDGSRRCLLRVHFPSFATF